MNDKFVPYCEMPKQKNHNRFKNPLWSLGF